MISRCALLFSVIALFALALARTTTGHTPTPAPPPPPPPDCTYCNNIRRFWVSDGCIAWNDCCTQPCEDDWETYFEDCFVQYNSCYVYTGCEDLGGCGSKKRSAPTAGVELVRHSAKLDKCNELMTKYSSHPYTSLPQCVSALFNATGVRPNRR